MTSIKCKKQSSPHMNTNCKNHLATDPKLCKSFPFIIPLKFFLSPVQPKCPILMPYHIPPKQHTNVGNTSTCEESTEQSGMQNPIFPHTRNNSSNNTAICGMKNAKYRRHCHEVLTSGTTRS